MGQQLLVTEGHEPASGRDFPALVLSLTACAFLLFFLNLSQCSLLPLSSTFQLLSCPFSVLPTRNTAMFFHLSLSLLKHTKPFSLFFFFFQQGNIFIVDYELLDGVDANKTDPCTIQYLAAPICLLYKNLENKIVPIAIQVSLLSECLKGYTAYCLILNTHEYGDCTVFISFSLVKSLGQKIPYSFLQMPPMTGCWPKSGFAHLISTSTRR